MTCKHNGFIGVHSAQKGKSASKSASGFKEIQGCFLLFTGVTSPPKTRLSTSSSASAPERFFPGDGQFLNLLLRLIVENVSSIVHRFVQLPSATLNVILVITSQHLQRTADNFFVLLLLLLLMKT